MKKPFWVSDLLVVAAVVCLPVVLLYFSSLIPM